jgi:hypothetical protein
MKLYKKYCRPTTYRSLSKKTLSTRNLLLSSLLTLSFITAFSLIGCNRVTNFWNASMLFKGSSSASIQKMAPQKLYTVQNNDLCAAYHGSMSPAIKEEINRRGLVEADEWSDINKNEVWKGMTYCQLFAALGKPKSAVIGEQFTEFSYPDGSYNFLNGELTTFSKK